MEENYRKLIRLVTDQRSVKDELADFLNNFLEQELDSIINKQTQYGNTPLSLAILSKKSPEFIEILLDFGADESIVDNDLKSPYDYSQENVKILLDPRYDSSNLIFKYIAEKNLDELEALNNYDVKVSYITPDKNYIFTLIDYAEYYKSYDCMYFLRTMTGNEVYLYNNAVNSNQKRIDSLIKFLDKIEKFLDFFNL